MCVTDLFSPQSYWSGWTIAGRKCVLPDWKPSDFGCPFWPKSTILSSMLPICSSSSSSSFCFSMIMTARCRSKCSVSLRVFEPATLDLGTGQSSRSYVSRMDVVVLETHVADRKDDYEVNANLPWRFISRLSCCGQDIRKRGAPSFKRWIRFGHAASTFSRSIMSSITTAIFPPHNSLHILQSTPGINWVSPFMWQIQASERSGLI